MNPEQLEELQQLTQAVEAEDNDAVYRQVDLSRTFKSLEQLLYKGFLTSVAQIGDTRITLKSLTPSEVHLSDFYADTINGIDPSARTRYLLSCSMFLINGQNVLTKREEVFDELVDTIGSVSDDMQALLMLRVLQLTDHATRCLHQVDGYCWHPMSRQRWLYYKSVQMNLSSVTGVPGTDILGLNQCQQLWVALNRMEDDRVQRESEWDNAKFVASGWSKSVKNVDSKDRARRRSLRIARQHEFMKAAGLSDQKGPAQLRVSAESMEELMSQLKRAMAGEKDLHDLVVEKHERQMRLEYDNQVDELKRLREEVPDYDGFMDQSVQVFDPNSIDSYVEQLRLEREERRRLRAAASRGQLVGSKRLEVLSRLTPPKALQVSKVPLVDDLTVRMSPDDTVNFIRPDGTVDVPIGGEE